MDETKDPAGTEQSRELLGRWVRQVWVQWASEQPDPKSSWLLPWEELDDGQREVDMRIGEALYSMGQAAADPKRLFGGIKAEWGNRTPWGSVSPAPNEKEARRMFYVALPGQRVLVSREVGPWVEAEHRELPHVYWPDPDEPGQRCACPIGADHSVEPG